jgi:lambda family phage portal protein
MFDFLKRAKNREAAKAGRKGSSIRAFAAADRLAAYLKPWTWDGGFSNAEILGSLATIRARSRDMEKNSEYYARWLDLFVANVVGDGFTLKATPCAYAGSAEIDEDAKRFLQDNFWRWARSPYAVDATGRKSFRGICKLMALNWARDGEGVAILADNGNGGISIRVVRPDALDETINGAGSSPDTVIRCGIEINRRTLRRVAYYFRTSKEDPSAVYINERPLVRVRAYDVLHVFSQHDEAQMRGIPHGYPVLRKLKMLDEFNLAEIVAARDEANTTGVFTAPAGREDEIASLNEDDEASAYLCRQSEPGTKYVLPQGWSYDTKTPQHPNREVSAFKNTMLRDIASGLSLEYANFANDWAGVSYSSVRVGTLAERDHWKDLQSDFIEQFVAPVYCRWLSAFLASPLGNPYVPSDYARLAEFEFRGRRWEWVDPLKDVNAAVTAVQHGWKTDEQIAADYGGDILENLEANAKVAERREDLGLGQPVIAGAAQQPTAPDTKGDDDADAPDDAKLDADADSEDTGD